MTGGSVGCIESGVLIGRDGHLFLVGGSHQVLNMVSGKRCISSGSIAAFRQNITDRHQYVHNCVYRHIIFPDKQSVLREQFPLGDPLCLGRLYLAKCKDLGGTIYYPQESLCQLGISAYQRTDTHLSDLGLLTVAVELASEIAGRPPPGCLEALLSKLNVEREVTGDLGSKLSPPVESRERFIHLDWPISEFHNMVPGGNNGIVDIYISPDSIYQKRILFFGDSFGRSLCRLLTYFFQEILFLRTPYFHPEIFDQYLPDMMITENVERYLDSCSSDANRPSFFMYPYLGGTKYEPARDFATAFSAVLSYPRQPHRLFVERIIDLHR
jgi:hypothetical protein